MPRTGPEFDEIIDYINERICHQCRARFRDDNRFAEHIRAHREGDPKVGRQNEQGMIADLMAIREKTGG